MIIPVFLGLLIILLWYQLKLEGLTVNPVWTSETGTDYGGNDLSTLSDTSLQDCKKQCIGNTSCKGISTDFDGDGPGTCWLKSDLTTGTPNTGRWVHKLKR
jgi:hypothetical protein